MTTAELDRLQHCAAVGREVRLPTVNGREIGPKRLRGLAALDRQRRARSETTSSTSATAALRLSVDHISESLRASEMQLHAAITHTRQQCTATSETAWLDPVTSPSCTWYYDMLRAILRLREKSDVAKGFQLIEKCCAGYKSVMQTQDPLLLWFTYCSILELSQVGMDIAVAFAKFAAGLCNIHEGRSHPLTILLTSMAKGQLGSAYKRHNIARVVEAQFDILVDKGDSASAKSWLVYAMLNLQRLTRTDSTQRRKHFVACPQNDERATEKSSSSIEPLKQKEMASWIQLYKAMVLVDRKEFIQASLVLSDEAYSDDKYSIPAVQIPDTISALRDGIEDVLSQYTGTQEFYKTASAAMLASKKSVAQSPTRNRLGVAYTAVGAVSSRKDQTSIVLTPQDCRELEAMVMAHKIRLELQSGNSLGSVEEVISNI